MRRRYEARCDSIICRELPGCDISTEEGMEKARENNLFDIVCPKMVQTAAEILEEKRKNYKNSGLNLKKVLT